MSKSCPRCKSKRLGDRLDGSHYCKRCGQRWYVVRAWGTEKEKDALLPSYDKRQDEKRNVLTRNKKFGMIKP